MKIKVRWLIFCLLFMIALSFTVRCLPSLIYRPYWIEYSIIGTLTLISIICVLININKMNFYLILIDFFFLSTPWMFFTGSVNSKYLFYTIVTIIC